MDDLKSMSAEYSGEPVWNGACHDRLIPFAVIKHGVGRLHSGLHVTAYPVSGWLARSWLVEFRKQRASWFTARLGKPRPAWRREVIMNKTYWMVVVMCFAMNFFGDFHLP